MLLGFLSALRKGHEEAMEKARREEKEEQRAAARQQGVRQPQRGQLPAEVTLAGEKSVSSSGKSSSRNKREAAPRRDRASIPAKRPAVALRTISSLTAGASFSKKTSDVSFGVENDAASSSEPPYGRQRSDLSGVDFVAPVPASAVAVGAAPSAVVTDTSSSGYTDHAPHDSSVGETDSSSSSENNANGLGSGKRGRSSVEEDEGQSTDLASSTNVADGASGSSEEDYDEMRPRSSSGPVKKRLKQGSNGGGDVGEFTSKNVADHNSRMEAMQGISRLSGALGPPGPAPSKPPGKGPRWQ